MEEDPLEYGQRAFPAQIINLKLKGRVQRLYPALDNSFFLALKCGLDSDKEEYVQDKYQTFLLHCSQESEVFWQKKVHNFCKVKMCNDWQVIYTNFENESIDILNLKTQTIESIPFKFMKDLRIDNENKMFDRYGTQIYLFEKRKLFCLFESNYQLCKSGFKSRVQLTFFSYDKVRYEPICVYQPKLALRPFFDPVHYVFKMNNDCKLSWMFYSQSKERQGMCLFELNHQNIPNVNVVEIANPNLIDQQALKIDDEDVYKLTVGLVREIEPNKYLLAASFQATQLFVLDTTPGYQQATISKLSIGDNPLPSPRDIPYQALFEEGPLLLLVVKNDIEKGKYTQLIVWSKEEVVINHVLNYDHDMKVSPRLMKARYLVQYSDKEDYVQIKLIDYQLTLGDGFLHMLLHLNEDFDDDLLQDCITLLQ